MSVPLAPILEFSIFNAILNKEISANEVERKTLSHTGQIIHKAIEKLEADNIPWDIQGVGLVATEGFGLDKTRLQEFLAAVEKNKTPAAISIHSLLRDRSALLNINNEIQKQLATGDLDLARIQQYTATKQARAEILSASEDLKDGTPEPPSGPGIRSLPRLSSCTAGIFGVVVYAGLPAIGKSTLAKQVAIDISREMPVLDYDFENTRRVLLYRFVENFGLDKARKIGQRWFIRESLRTLNKDLAKIKPPATIIVDSIQKIATKGDDRREGIDGWIHRFEELKQEGYNVILVSEINRASYTGDPRMDCFKETGALEYAADTAVVLTERSNGLIGAHIVKNRHYPNKGLVTLMERAKPFWFREVDIDGPIFG